MDTKKKPQSLFVKTAKKLGYLKKGKDFKLLPKKGSPEYKKIVKQSGPS